MISRSFSFRRLSPIGVDVGARQVKAVQLARTRGRGAGAASTWRIAAAASFPRATFDPAQPFDAHEAERLAGVLDRQGFIGRDVVVAMPHAHLMTSVLELPQRAPGVPLEQIARLELARVHQREPASFEFAQWEVPPPARAAKATHVMAVACDHERATALLDVLDQQNLRTRAIDADQCAVVRACAPLLPHSPQMKQQGVSAVLDLGYSAARLTIVHHGVIVYGRAIDDGGMHVLHRTLDHALRLDDPVALGHLLDEGLLNPAEDASDMGDEARSLGGSGAEARGVLAAHLETLVKEINVATSYASHQYADAALSSLLLVGGGAELGGVAEHLGSMLGVAVQVVRPAALVAWDASSVGTGATVAGATASASMIGAIGLAMYVEGSE